jgi:hypothetical protein
MKYYLLFILSQILLVISSSYSANAAFPVRNGRSVVTKSISARNKNIFFHNIFFHSEKLKKNYRSEPDERSGDLGS